MQPIKNQTKVKNLTTGEIGFILASRRTVTEGVYSYSIAFVDAVDKIRIDNWVNSKEVECV
jgi:hypothetical protein